MKQLSSRELQVAFLICRGRTYKEIGKMLNLSPKTVENYVENIKNKLGCSFKSDIIDFFEKNKNIDETTIPSNDKTRFN